MTCIEAENLLLEADPATLAGRGEPSLAAHLRACPRCQRTAALILTAHQHDSTEYLATAARRSPKAVAEWVMATPRGKVPGPSPARRSMLRWIGLSLVPIAATVAIVLVDNTRRDARRAAFQTSIDAAFAAGSPITSVKVPPGRNAFVFKTRDPNISVVWIY